MSLPQSLTIISLKEMRRPPKAPYLREKLEISIWTFAADFDIMRADVCAECKISYARTQN